MSIALTQDINSSKFFEEAKESYRQRDWKKAAWYYNKYLNNTQEKDNLYLNSLQTLADIYYYHLKRYAQALDMYIAINEKLSDMTIEHKIRRLSVDNDEDGFTYAQEHDLGTSDRIHILNEINKIIPQECSITYIKKGGFSGEIMKHVKLSKELNNVYVYNDKREKLSVLEINDFLRTWVSLQLIEPEDIPEDNVIWNNGINEITLHDFPSSVVMDATYVEIIVFSGNKIKKVFIINPLEMASKRLHKIVQNLNEISDHKN